MADATMNPEQKLRCLWKEMADVSQASAALGWDQETLMPANGQEGRGQVLATLAGLRHRLLSSPELSDVLDECTEAAEQGSDLEAMARLGRQRVDRARKVPEELAKALAAATSQGLAVWQEARKRDDFSHFLPSLTEIIELRKEEAAAIDSSASAYEVLMDEYEPGAQLTEIEALFKDLKEALVPLAQEGAEISSRLDLTGTQGEFALDAQKAFGAHCAEAIGFDFDSGRLDASAHPFCSGFNPGDVRITWRGQKDDFRPAVFGILHEAGHGLYEQGLPKEWQGTPLGSSVSLGIHESQSRLYENLVARSRGFWSWALPTFQELFPAEQGKTLDQLWPALHGVTPSLVRVEADETTYNLHILVRFELERRLFSGGIAVEDLPAAWNQEYEDTLGVTPPSDADGVLQDIHWAMGAFGYFPTYTLGNLAASQLFDAAETDLGDLEEQFSQGAFSPMRNWLGDKIHSQGSRWTAADLLERATGEAPQSQAFLQHIRNKIDALKAL